MTKRYTAILSGLIVLFCIGLVSAPAAPAQQTPLPEELSGFSIRDTFAPLDAPVIGTVQSLTGRLIVRHGRGFAAYYASVGDRLYEHDVLYTLAGTRCRIRFVTADIITMAENSHISVDQLTDDRHARKKRSLFSMLKGKAMFYVVRVFRYKQVDTQVRTPTAIAGVRGTKFGVKVTAISEKTAAARPIYLADASGMLPPGLLAQNAADGGFQTTVYGFDGEVAVTSTVDNTTQTVAAGQNITVGPVGAGSVTVTPPVEARQFSDATEAPAADSQTDEGSGDTGANTGTGETGETSDDTTASGETGETGDDTAASGESDADTSPATDDIVADSDLIPVTPPEVSPEPLPPTPAPIATGTQVGYFSALLTGFDGTAYNLADVYTNKTRSDLDAAAISGNSIVNSAGTITAVGTGVENETPFVKQIKSAAVFPGPYDSGDLGTTRQMDQYPDDMLGENAYMEWGYWTMSTWTPDTLASGLQVAISNRAYHLGGLVTPDDAVKGITGNYSGSAYGTYFNGATGINMSGYFDSYIDVPQNLVSYFYLTVSGGGKSATIDAAGNFNGSSGEFKISGGNWSLSAGPVVSSGVLQPNASAACIGSIYGPNGEAMGGAWAMDLGAGNNAAVGIFAGEKTSGAVAP